MQTTNQRLLAVLYKHYTALYNPKFFARGIAQLGERLHGMQEVRGSIPRTSTSKSREDSFRVPIV